MPVPRVLLSYSEKDQPIWLPVALMLALSRVVQPSRVVVRTSNPVSVGIESISTLRKCPSRRRFRADSATRALSHGWPGLNRSSRRITQGRVTMWRLFAQRAYQ